jgi:VWFA-related protein
MLRRTILSLLPAATLAGQESKVEPAVEPKIPGAAPIRVSVNEVIVPVTVTDDKGRFVTDLDKEHFKIFEEGKEQKINYFNRERNQPVVIGFLLDVSNASRQHWKTFQEAAIDLVQTLLPGDKRYSGYLVSYATDAELQVNTTNDPEAIMAKIRKIKPGGGAAMYDAIYMACTSRDLVKGEPIEPRRIIVIIGDGHDSASKKTHDEVQELAQRNLVTIYGISTVAFGFVSDGEKQLLRLTDATGGRVEAPLNKGLYKDISGYLSTPSDEGNYAIKVGTGGYASEIAQGMFRAIANVSGEVTTQYVMRYIPENSDSPKVYRKIRVEVVGYPNLRIRHRDGYYPYNP